MWFLSISELKTKQRKQIFFKEAKQCQFGHFSQLYERKQSLESDCVSDVMRYIFFTTSSCLKVLKKILLFFFLWTFVNLDQNLAFKTWIKERLRKNYHQCCQDLHFSETGFVSKSGTQCDSSNWPNWTQEVPNKASFNRLWMLVIFFFKHILFNVNCRPSNICSLHTYGVR